MRVAPPDAAHLAAREGPPREAVHAPPELRGVCRRQQIQEGVAERGMGAEVDGEVQEVEAPREALGLDHAQQRRAGVVVRQVPQHHRGASALLRAWRASRTPPLRNCGNATRARPTALRLARQVLRLVVHLGAHHGLRHTRGGDRPLNFGRALERHRLHAREGLLRQGGSRKSVNLLCAGWRRLLLLPSWPALCARERHEGGVPEGVHAEALRRPRRRLPHHLSWRRDRLRRAAKHTEEGALASSVTARYWALEPVARHDARHHRWLLLL
mmetsp:Transcript_100238/g.280852  ORF Transcript_100238/g.280852 Transcript_100238/m.280852 type:complete len:270 (-) Transcript_100238:322-1131(-)